MPAICKLWQFYWNVQVYDLTPCQPSLSNAHHLTECHKSDISSLRWNKSLLTADFNSCKTCKHWFHNRTFSSAICFFFRNILKILNRINTPSTISSNSATESRIKWYPYVSYIFEPILMVLYYCNNSNI